METDRQDPAEDIEELLLDLERFHGIKVKIEKVSKKED